MTVIILTAVQANTYNTLVANANSKDVVSADIVLAQKQNVIGALAKKGAIVPFYTNFKLTDAVVVCQDLLPTVGTKGRPSRELAAMRAEAIQQLAAA